MKRETRFHKTELRIDQTEGEPTKLVGYAATFDSLSHDLGGFREKIAPGTFARSIRKKQDVIGNVDHDDSRILARTTAGTLILEEDIKGLRFSIKIPNTTAGKDCLENVRNGNYSGCSFAFVTVKDDFSKADGETIRELQDVDLFDVSVVCTPAYPDTELALRSLKAWEKRAEHDEEDEEEDEEEKPEDETVDDSAEDEEEDEKEEPEEEDKGSKIEQVTEFVADQAAELVEFIEKQYEAEQIIL